MERDDSSGSETEEKLPRITDIKPEEVSDDREVASCDQTMDENSSSMESPLELRSYSGASGEAENKSYLGSYRDPVSLSEESVSRCSLLTVGTATTASMTSEGNEDSSSSKQVLKNEGETSSDSSSSKQILKNEDEASSDGPKTFFRGRFTECKKYFCLTGSKRGGKRTRSPETDILRDISSRTEDFPCLSPQKISDDPINFEGNLNKNEGNAKLSRYERNLKRFLEAAESDKRIELFKRNKERDLHEIISKEMKSDGSVSSSVDSHRDVLNVKNESISDSKSSINYPKTEITSKVRNVTSDICSSESSRKGNIQVRDVRQELEKETKTDINIQMTSPVSLDIAKSGAKPLKSSPQSSNIFKIPDLSIFPRKSPKTLKNKLAIPSNTSPSEGNDKTLPTGRSRRPTDLSVGSRKSFYVFSPGSRTGVLRQCRSLPDFTQLPIKERRLSMNIGNFKKESCVKALFKEKSPKSFSPKTSDSEETKDSCFFETSSSSEESVAKSESSDWIPGSPDLDEVFLPSASKARRKLFNSSDSCENLSPKKESLLDSPLTVSTSDNEINESPDNLTDASGPKTLSLRNVNKVCKKLTYVSDSYDECTNITKTFQGSSGSSLDLPTVTQDMTTLQIDEGASEQVEEKSGVSLEKLQSLKRKRSPDTPQQEGSGTIPKRARYASQSEIVGEARGLSKRAESEERKHSEAASKSSEKSSVEERVSASVSLDESISMDKETVLKGSRDEEDSSAKSTDKGVKRRSLSPDATDDSEAKKIKKSES